MLTAVAIGGMMVSCADDYLQTEPITTFDSSVVSQSTQAARLAMYGMCKSMYDQYGDLDITPNFNGEPFIMTFYGDVPSADFFSYLWSQALSTDGYLWKYMNLDNYINSAYAWRYCYNIINQANNILDGFKNASGTVSDKNMIEAQVRTLRAHAYCRILQLYAPRWEDSNNGNTYCVVLRTKPGTEDVPLSTMNELLAQLHEDLTEAIRLYGESTAKREFGWEPNVNIAKGIYARVAMIEHDYVTAQKMASEAREGYAIMTADEYKAGFNEANSEWMWYSTSESTALYYWGNGTWYGCNGAYILKWPYGGPSINYELYKQLDVKNDVRAELYWTPDKPVRKGKPADFWSTECVNATSMDMNNLSAKMVQGIQAYQASLRPANVPAEYGAYQPEEGSTSGSNPNAMFGAHFKFWTLDQYGTMPWIFMRASEMALTEAEAAYHNSDFTACKSALEAVNKNRIKNYSCTSSGQALLDEIRLTKRIEFWGEGQNWFDYKRWNLPIERKAWVEGDVESNNIPATYCGTLNPEDNHGWRYNLPKGETDFNHAADRTLWW